MLFPNQRVPAAFLLIIAGLAAPICADSPKEGLRTIRTIPRTQNELELAHQRSRSNACEQLEPDEPIELSSFTPYLTRLDRARQDQRPDPATRRGILTVGLDMNQQDQSRLPKLSRSAILDYLAKHHVNIQVRIQKDQETGQLYLHHRPLAATVGFAGSRVSLPFNETVSLAVAEFHSLGLYLPVRSKPTSENLRTLVLVFRNRLVSPSPSGGKDSSKFEYELAFFRARTDPSDKGRLVLDAFVTTEKCRNLHHVRPLVQPSRVDECSLRGTIVITSFQSGNLVPKESATRRIQVASRSSYPMNALDQSVRTSGRKGDALDHLNEVLDAIVDGRPLEKIAPEKGPSESPTTTTNRP